MRPKPLNDRQKRAILAAGLPLVLSDDPYRAILLARAAHYARMRALGATVDPRLGAILDSIGWEPAGAAVIFHNLGAAFTQAANQVDKLTKAFNDLGNSMPGDAR